MNTCCHISNVCLSNYSLLMYGTLWIRQSTLVISHDEK